MAILDSVKIKKAKLVEKTKHAFAIFHYLHPTRSRLEKRDATVKMKAIATEKRKAKEKAIRKDSKEKAIRKDSKERNPKPSKEPRHFHLHFNHCTCFRCFSVQ